MLGEESDSADYWKACGDSALANGIKHVIIMVCTVLSFLKATASCDPGLGVSVGVHGTQLYLCSGPEVCHAHTHLPKPTKNISLIRI